MDRLKREWTMRMAESMELLYPELDQERIQRYVNRIYEERVTDHKVQLYNNYENVVADTSLVRMVDWMKDTNPLIAESGVFFYQKNIRRNVNVEIIKECMLDARTIHKKEKFEAMEAGDSFTAAIKDIQQGNDKKGANSGFGAEGQSSSFLYNIHSAMSVTACGRGQLSTACQCFENLLADNVKFFDMNEFFTWVYNIVHEKPSWTFDTFDCISHQPTKEEFVERYVNKFGHPSLVDRAMVEQVFDSLDEEMRIRVFYKANLIEFLANRLPSDIFGDIAKTDVSFINPNKIPGELKGDIDRLVALVMEFVNYKHSLFRYEDRTRYQRRACVIVMD